MNDLRSRPRRPLPDTVLTHTPGADVRAGDIEGARRRGLRSLPARAHCLFLKCSHGLFLRAASHVDFLIILLFLMGSCWLFLRADSSYGLFWYERGTPVTPPPPGADVRAGDIGGARRRGLRSLPARAHCLAQNTDAFIPHEAGSPFGWIEPNILSMHE